jgi:hypothetical protein
MPIGIGIGIGIGAREVLRAVDRAICVLVVMALKQVYLNI